MEEKTAGNWKLEIGGRVFNVSFAIQILAVLSMKHIMKNIPDFMESSFYWVYVSFFFLHLGDHCMNQIIV